MQPKRYEELDHTADVKLRIFGASERELFVNAAFALFDKMVDLSRVESRRTVEIEASGADVEETLVNFLAELLYRYNAGRFICRECRITELAPTRVRSVCTGEDFDPARHEARAEIKAVTFHDVKITRTADGLEVTLTCDV